MCPNGRDYCESNPNDRDTCRACRKAIRRAATRTGEVQPFYVVAYGIDRCYGGPQEGGWWYDATTIHKVYKVWTVRQALAFARMLREQYPKPRHPRYSVIGGQDQYVQTFYDPSQFPVELTERPRYE